MENKEKIGMKDAVRINLRAIRLLWGKCSSVFWLIMGRQAVNAIIPYSTVWFSAKIISELAGNRSLTVLRNNVLILLLTECGLGMLSGILWYYKNCRFWLAAEQIGTIYMDKFLSMDFAAVDSSRVQDLYAQILQNENWASKGLKNVLFQFEQLMEAFFGLIGGILLSWSLFTIKVPETAGRMTVLNHFLFPFLFVLLMVGTAVLSTAVGNRAAECEDIFADTFRLGNRMFGFFGFVGYKRERALDVRLYNQEKICRNSYLRGNVFGIHSEIAKISKGKMGLLYMLSDAIGKLFYGAVYLFVGLKAWSGAFGIGAVSRYLSAVTMLYKKTARTFIVLGDMQRNALFLRNTFEFLDIPNAMYQGSLTVEKRSDCQYEIEFRHVSFRYPETDRDVLKDVSLKFQVGKKLAVVGENGSGKTTFIKLLCRLYDPTEGEILLNGIDIRKYDYREYMSVFSVVFQDFSLLAVQLGQNVAASAEYDREKAAECLEKSSLNERFTAMKDGLDTWLYKTFDEKGVTVSGGEAQKIALARALYKDAAFLILDEPTAALDPIAEAEIYEKFNEIAGERTAVYISHRLSSCKFCDEILVFQEGCVVQHGSHAGLVADRDGRYYELWSAQAQYYVESAGACS